MSGRYYDDGPPGWCLAVLLAILSAGLSVVLYVAVRFVTRPF